MKNIFALIMSLICILVFAACVPVNTEISNPKPAIPNQSDVSLSDGAFTADDHTSIIAENTTSSAGSPEILTEHTGASSETNETSTNKQNTDLYGVLDSMIENHGFPFRLWHSEGADYYDFIFMEDSAQREIFVNFDGPYTMSNLSWSITENELVISGEWEETFIIDMDSGVAKSENDGKEYWISTQQQDGEYLVWQPLVSNAE